MKNLYSEKMYSDYNSSKIVLVPVPYEKTTSYGKGTVKGPGAILEALDKVECYDIEEARVTSNIGIAQIKPLKNINNQKALFDKVESATNKVLDDNKIPVYLGGEHTISAAAVSALKKRRSDFCVLHFDAHSDMRDKYNGEKYSHACVMRRIFEMGVDSVSVGIRSQCFTEHEFIKNNGIKIFYAHQILKDPNWMDKAARLLSDKLYITFDVDVFDPSLLRATGTPEPGGLGWFEIVDFLKVVAKNNKELIGMDLVELAPTKDDIASNFICAKLIYKILTLFVK